MDILTVSQNLENENQGIGKYEFPVINTPFSGNLKPDFNTLAIIVDVSGSTWNIRGNDRNGQSEDPLETKFYYFNRNKRHCLAFNKHL